MRGILNHKERFIPASKCEESDKVAFGKISRSRAFAVNWRQQMRMHRIDNFLKSKLPTINFPHLVNSVAMSDLTFAATKPK